jgi:hypothetical protein
MFALKYMAFTMRAFQELFGLIFYVPFTNKCMFASLSFDNIVIVSSFVLYVYTSSAVLVSCSLLTVINTIWFYMEI